MTSTEENFMPDEWKSPDAIHFKSIRLENVRAFGSSQSIDFVDENGKPSLWNLILGENGVGKTTLMWAIAVMQPVPALEQLAADETGDSGDPKLSKAEFSAYENYEIMRFFRSGEILTMKIDAELVTDEGTEA